MCVFIELSIIQHVCIGGELDRTLTHFWRNPASITLSSYNNRMEATSESLEIEPRLDVGLESASVVYRTAGNYRGAVGFHI